MNIQSSGRSIKILILYFSLLCVFLFLTSKAHPLSIEEEREMGQAFLAQILQQLPVLDDDFANKIINDLGRYLLSSIESQPFEFHFYIIKDNDMNAFAAPGGHIFIFSGLINAMDSVDELAVVICHEIGHVTARHLSERIERGRKLGMASMAAILAGALLGGTAAEAVLTGTMAASEQLQLHYSRDNERQADLLAFKYMRPTGFEPKEMITTIEKIQKSNWMGTDRIPAYLLTHPAGPERTANFDTLLKDFSPKSPIPEKSVRMKAHFSVLKAIVRAESLDSQEAIRLFKTDLQNDPYAAVSHLGLGLVYKSKMNYSEARSHFEWALELDPELIPALANLGEVLQMQGRYRDAILVFEKVLRLDRNDRTALFLLGLSYEELGQYQEALEQYKRLASLKPVRPEVYHHLGLAYGRQNQLAPAHYYLGLYFKKEGQAGKARFHFEKALTHSGDDHRLREKIKREMKSTPNGA